MSDDTTPPEGGETQQQPETQSVTPLGAHPSLTAYHSTWMPAPGGATPHSTWMPVPTLTATLDGEGKPQPGRYKVETHAVTEFEVLENGHVVVHRAEHTGGAPERQE